MSESEKGEDISKGVRLTSAASAAGKRLLGCLGGSLGSADSSPSAQPASSIPKIRTIVGRAILLMMSHKREGFANTSCVAEKNIELCLYLVNTPRRLATPHPAWMQIQGDTVAIKPEDSLRTAGRECREGSEKGFRVRVRLEASRRQKSHTTSVDLDII